MVYIEFDGIMENSTIYVNGTQIAQHPYGYVSLRYDITSAVTADGTTDNVIAVETNTTTQPAERFYAGAGIYRHVRMIVTNPVHVDQWATYIYTPAPTTTAATVNVTTTVLNSGATSQSVTVQGVVTSPTGTSLAPVTTAAQTVAAGARVNYTFTVPVTNPQLWNLDTPNMYTLTTSVLVGGTAVDDNVQDFGIRRNHLQQRDDDQWRGHEVQGHGEPPGPSRPWDGGSAACHAATAGCAQEHWVQRLPYRPPPALAPTSSR